MTLTPQDKRRLKSLGQTMPDDVRVGHDGLTDGGAAHVAALLARKELVKVRFEELEGARRKAFAAELADALDAQCITVVGRTALLYRPNPDLDPARRVLQ